MPDWRDLVLQNQQFQVDNAKNNPGLAAMGQIIEFAMKNDIKKAEFKRQETSDIKKAGMAAVYNRYPQIAAKQLGMDTSGLPSSAVTQPPGTALSQVTYDEYGQPQTTFKSTAVSEGDLAEMYNRTILEVDKTNSLNAILPKYKPMPKPTFAEWKKERGFGAIAGVQTGTDEELLAIMGITEEDIAYTIQLHPEITKKQIIAAIRANAQ